MKSAAREEETVVMINGDIVMLVSGDRYSFSTAAAFTGSTILFPSRKGVGVLHRQWQWQCLCFIHLPRRKQKVSICRSLFPILRNWGKFSVHNGTLRERRKFWIDITECGSIWHLKRRLYYRAQRDWYLVDIKMNSGSFPKLVFISYQFISSLFCVWTWI